MSRPNMLKAVQRLQGELYDLIDASPVDLWPDERRREIEFIAINHMYTMLLTISELWNAQPIIQLTLDTELKRRGITKENQDGE